MSGVRVSRTRSTVTTTEAVSTVLVISTGFVVALLGAAFVAMAARTVLLALAIGATIVTLAFVAGAAMLVARNERARRERVEVSARAVGEARLGTMQVQPAAALSSAEREELAGYRAMLGAAGRQREAVRR